MSSPEKLPKGKNKITSTKDTIYQFKINVDHIKPAIWRQVQIKSDDTLEQLHLCLNEAMGWENFHLHEFIFDIGDYDERIKEKKIKINQVVTHKNQRFKYIYDFGDDWEHTVILEKILDAKKAITYPRCIAGARACPLEDCGSYSGYKRICKIMKKPKTSEYRNTLEWLGCKYNPEEFNLEDINAMITSRVQNKTGGN